ncbi:MAG: hypothetical protein WD845_14385 [Pirellulales bacterium]
MDELRPNRRWLPLIALTVLATGLLWFFGALAFFAVAQAIEVRGGAIVVPEPIGFLIYIEPWLAGPVLILVGTCLCAVTLIFRSNWKRRKL